jgi:hypothetical protein
VGHDRGAELDRVGHVARGLEARERVERPRRMRDPGAREAELLGVFARSRTSSIGEAASHVSETRDPDLHGSAL